MSLVPPRQPLEQLEGEPPPRDGRQVQDRARARGEALGAPLDGAVDGAR